MGLCQWVKAHTAFTCLRIESKCASCPTCSLPQPTVSLVFLTSNVGLPNLAVRGGSRCTQTTKFAVIHLAMMIRVRGVFLLPSTLRMHLWSFTLEGGLLTPMYESVSHTCWVQPQLAFAINPPSTVLRPWPTIKWRAVYQQALAHYTYKEEVEVTSTILEDTVVQGLNQDS